MMRASTTPTRPKEVAMLHARMEEQHIEPRCSPAEVDAPAVFIRDAVHVDDKIMEYIVRSGADPYAGRRRPPRSARAADAGRSPDRTSTCWL